jgi:hypothetical protein
MAGLVNFARLNGLWTDGSDRRVVISCSRERQDFFTIDMSDWDRPEADGRFLSEFVINAHFPDDARFTGRLEIGEGRPGQPQGHGRITWSNSSQWLKVVRTVIDLNGGWTDGSERRAVISEKRTSFTIDMSDWDRPAAHGTIVDATTIRVTFPDDQTYTGTLEFHRPQHRIIWSNNSIWLARS